MEAEPEGSGIEALNDELALLFCAFLPGSALGMLACCSKRWRRLAGAAELWRGVLREEFRGLGAELQDRAERIHRLARPPPAAGEQAAAAPLPAPSSERALRRRFELATRISASDTRVRWQKLKMGNQWRAQEGHSAALLDGRWMVVVGGFGGGIRNDVAALDTFSLSSESPSWIPVQVSGTRPRPKYGHTSTALPPSIFGHALGLLGGVQYGSYQGDVGDFSVLQVDLPPDTPAEAAGAAGQQEDDLAQEEEGEIRELTARWLPVEAVDECEGRAYHAACVAEVGEAKMFVCFGVRHNERFGLKRKVLCLLGACLNHPLCAQGIHDSAPSASLQML